MGCRSYNCPLYPTCIQTFSRNSDAKRHLLSGYHLDIRNLCPVPGCKDSYSQKSALKNHVRDHFEGPLSRFLCKEPGCRKRFRDPSSASRHYREVHSETPLYICEAQGCTASYARPTAFKKHMAKKHPDFKFKFKTIRTTRKRRVKDADDPKPVKPVQPVIPAPDESVNSGSTTPAAEWPSSVFPPDMFGSTPAEYDPSLHLPPPPWSYPSTPSDSPISCCYTNFDVMHQDQCYATECPPNYSYNGPAVAEPCIDPALLWGHS